MPKTVRCQQLGEFWLYMRPDSKSWYIACLKKLPGQRSRTARISTGIIGGSKTDPPDEAITALTEHYQQHKHLGSSINRTASVDEIFAQWLRIHVSKLVAKDRYAYSVGHWLAFFSKLIEQGRITPPVTVDQLGVELFSEFEAWREQSGVGGHTIARDLSAMRGALSWAAKHRYIPHAIFVPDVSNQKKAPPRDRILTVSEIGRILDACGDRLERSHLVDFIVAELSTAGRPEAILALTDQNLDWERMLINPNEPGKAATIKRCAIVPMSEMFAARFENRTGKLIRFRTLAKSKVGDVRYIERPTRSIRTVWKNCTLEAGVSGATPKTLRHTVLTYLARRKVPKELRATFAGHRPMDTTARNYEHLEPEDLKDVIVVVDDFMNEIQAHTSVDLRSSCDPAAKREE